MTTKSASGSKTLDGDIKKKRSKSFTGCFTCRKRKIRCDLARPSCQRCVKSGLKCRGYGIKLRWSKPLQFDDETGVAPSGAFQSQENEEDKKFHRREIDLVHWDKEKYHRPYLYYQDMDRDLNVLHNSADDQMLSKSTKLLGPFGVFALNNTEQTLSMDFERDSDGLNRDKMLSSVNGLASIPTAPNLTPANGSGKSTTPIRSDVNAEASNLHNGVAPHDQLWLSNELRDDALLTAAALNGDTQFLDIMSAFSTTPNGSVMTPMNYTGTNLNYNTNQNEFLNLVFHRNSANQHYNSSLTNQLAPQSQPETEQQSSSMNDILNHPYSSYNDYYYNNPFKQNQDLEIHLDASTTQAGTDIIEGDQSSATTMPPSIMCVVESHLEPKLGFEITIPQTADAHTSPGIPISALQVQPLTRYLLNHYITQVADLMTVIPLTENPWKTIYFPRALSAIGELAALGKTSDAKNALLNALLAVSAFNLQSKFPKNSKAMKYYLHLGIRLRNQASLFVKKLLSHSTNEQSSIEHCVKHYKYKDVLCAVMSMISVDLVWGTMQDTHFYITWCGKVIAQKMHTKRKLSSKARILHRIFASLKLIQDSTCLDVNLIKGEDRDGYDVNGDKFANDTISAKNRIDFIVNNNTDPIGISSITRKTPLFHNKKLINTKKNDANFATDALYGLPNSLILLFSETVSMVRTRIYHQDTYRALPEAFQQEVEVLGKKLKSWSLDWILYQNQEDEDEKTIAENNGESKQFFSLMHEATYHHIMSFYHALNIYYHKLVTCKPREDIQHLVVKTLQHLNSIQELIGQDKAAIIPLFWQGFIAGCEAVSEELQLEFKKWGADIAQYLGSYWGARQIMLEVWRRKKMREDRDDWVCVIQDWEMNLMLN